MVMYKFILFMSLMSIYQCRVPEKVFCVNEKCSEPISKAKTLLPYNSPSPELISFTGNSEAIVYMKSTGTDANLWYASINGKLGFVNPEFLREYKVIQKTSQLKIIEIDPKRLQPPVQPNKVQQPHEVFEGTTIFTTESNVNAQADSFTESPVPVANDNVTPSLTEPAPVVENVVEDAAPGNNYNVNIPEPAVSSQESVNSKEQSTTESIDQNNQVPQGSTIPETISEPPQVPNQYIPAIPAPEIILSNLSADDVSVNTIEMPEKLNTAEVIAKADDTESAENSSNSGNTIDKLPLDTVKETNNVPEVTSSENLKNNDGVQIFEVPNNDSNNSQETENTNGANELPPSQESQITVPEAIQIEEAPVKPVDNSVEVLNPDVPLYPSPEVKESPANIILNAPEPQHMVSPENNIYMYPSSTDSPIQESTTENVYNPYLAISVPPAETQSTETSTTEVPVNVDPEMQSSSEQIPDVTEPPSTVKEELSTQELIEEIFTSTTEHPASQEDSSDGFLSNIYSTVSELSDLWSTTTEKPLVEDLFQHEEKSVSNDVDESFSFMKFVSSFMGPKEESKALFPTQGETCYTEEYCDGTSNDQTNRLLTFLLTTATSVLLFTLGYYYIDNKRQDERLIGTINSLQRDLLFTSKECEILKEELATTKTKLTGIEDSSFGMDDMVQSLKEEIEEMKAQNERLRRSLDDNEKLLRVSENTAGELQNTLGEVENTLSELLSERANSDENIAELNGKVQAFEEELISVSRDRDNYQLKFVSAETALEEAKKQMKQLDDLTQKLSEANNTIDLQKHEISALKDALKEMKTGSSSNVDVTSLIDHTEIKAKLSKALEEKHSFEKKFEVEYKERKRLSEELQVTQETLQTTSQQATEALTRLEVLGKYFQERETELMKELNAKESMWLSKQGESASTVEKIELLQQEVQRHKEKCDALALELAEQESMRRTAVSEVETRAHSAWLEARAARREADAARDEAAALRRKLASVAADGAASPHHKVASPLEVGEGAPPPLGGMPFLPPPLLPPLPRNVPPLLPPLPRPPPLGRLPSPHPPRYGDRRYSPDSRYSPNRYSPESRYSPDTVRYSPDSRYSPRVRRSPYSPRSRRRSRSRERYNDGRGSRTRNGPAVPADTETEYNSDSPSREPRRRRRYSRQSGPSSGSGCSSESDK